MPDPRATLREIATDLRRELVTVEVRLGEAARRAIESEARAMTAIGHGFDGSAHDEMIAFQSAATEMEQLDADAEYWLPTAVVGGCTPPTATNNQYPVTL